MFPYYYAVCILHKMPTNLQTNYNKQYDLIYTLKNNSVQCGSFNSLKDIIAIWFTYNNVPWYSYQLDINVGGYS